MCERIVYGVQNRTTEAYESVQFWLDSCVINVEPVQRQIAAKHNHKFHRLREIANTHTHTHTTNTGRVRKMTKTETIAEPEDPVESMLKKTGCINLHYKVQECIAETQDWRKCQSVVKNFKDCMAKYSEDQRKKYQ